MIYLFLTTVDVGRPLDEERVQMVYPTMTEERVQMVYPTTTEHT